jgi:hypothetical protein
MAKARQTQTISPAISAVFGCPIDPRMRALAMTAGEAKAILWTMVDDAGQPVDCSDLITGGGALPGAQAVLAEAVRGPVSGERLVATASFADAAACAAGRVDVAVPDQVKNNPGIYQFEIGVVDPAGPLVLVNAGRLVVQRSLLSTGAVNTSVLPTVRELRLRLGDSSAGENVRLGAVEFDLAMLAVALEAAPTVFNEMPPPIDTLFSTCSFPFREAWLDVAVARLYQMAAHWMRRNRLPIQAGGVTVDDLGKADEYEAKAQAMLAEALGRLTMIKIRMNAEGCFQSSSGGRWPTDW